MESIILVLLTGCLCIWSFSLGVKVGRKEEQKEEKKEPPTMNLLKVYREMEEKKEADRQRDRFDAIMRNIDNYDGTSYRQEEVR